MNKLSTEKRCLVVSALVEGCSIRNTVRMTGISKNTVTKLLVDLGTVCAQYQFETLRNLPCKRLQVDTIWSFVACKRKNRPKDRQDAFGVGEVWTWTAIDADTKLVPSWLVGPRDSECAKFFMGDLASRLLHRVRLTSDGHRPYLEAVEHAFGGDIDYEMLVKMFGKSPEDERRYSPPTWTGCERKAISGLPDRKHVSTSYAERQNLTMRMKMRRIMRLTNAFSKKVENHAHAISLHFMHYNFARIRQTLKCTPAMRAGVTGHLWKIRDVIELLEKAESEPN